MNERKKSINTKGFYEYKFYEDKIYIDFRVGNFPCAELAVFEYVTASYKNAALLLLLELEKYDALDNKIYKQCSTTFFLPAMFCFRHYIELKIKCLYMWYYKEGLLLDNGKNSHKLKELFEKLQKTSNNKFSVFTRAIDYIEKYEKFSIDNKSNPSYFRYLTDKNYKFEEHLEIPISDTKIIKNFITEIEFRTEQIKQSDWLHELLTQDASRE